MHVSATEWWVVIHGMGAGALFLLVFAGGFAGLWSLRPEWVTEAGFVDRLRRLKFGTFIMAAVAWIACITGTYIVYPWYRAKPPAGTTDLSEYPRSFLLADPDLAGWHGFAMEWKEHVAWLSPILATVVAYLVWRHGRQLMADSRLRSAAMILFCIAFAAAGVAGLYGAFINKMAPIS